ncbi:hypothetical protein WJX73_001374 [Symbiochloris irregularis]|uniref:Secreted protein n=1 Tax=Symbiochloris irregularis TaxID=706552 RepID=A0AAW1PG98_9CHLO
MLWQGFALSLNFRSLLSPRSVWRPAARLASGLAKSRSSAVFLAVCCLGFRGKANVRFCRRFLLLLQCLDSMLSGNCPQIQHIPLWYTAAITAILLQSIRLGCLLCCELVAMPLQSLDAVPQKLQDQHSGSDRRPRLAAASRF